MGWLGRIDNLPIVLFEHLTLFIRQAALWIVQDQPWTQGGECCVDVNGVGVAWKIHRMHPMIWKMSAQPFDSLEVRGEPVLNDQIFTKPQNIGGIEQRLFFCGDKEFVRRPLQSFFNTDLFRQVIGMIICIGQPRFGCGFMAKFGVLFKIFLHQGAVVQIFKPATAIRHGCFEHFRTDGQQDIARRHTTKLALRREIWSLHWH